MSTPIPIEQRLAVKGSYVYVVSRKTGKAWPYEVLLVETHKGEGFVYARSRKTGEGHSLARSEYLLPHEITDADLASGTSPVSLGDPVTLPDYDGTGMNYGEIHGAEVVKLSAKWATVRTPSGNIRLPRSVVEGAPAAMAAAQARKRLRDFEREADVRRSP